MKEVLVLLRGNRIEQLTSKGDKVEWKGELVDVLTQLRGIYPDYKLVVLCILDEIMPDEPIHKLADCPEGE